MTFYFLGLFLFGGIGIALASSFLAVSLGNGEMIYWFCVGGLIGGILAAFGGFVLDARSLNRRSPAKEPLDPTAVPATANAVVRSKLRRCLDLGAAVITIAAIAGTVYLVDHFSPGRRLDRAMKPFVDANIELLVVYNRVVEEGDRSRESDDLIAAYELIRHQGLVAAKEELGDEAFNGNYSNEHPLIACSARAQRRIIDEFKGRCPGETAQKIARDLSQIWGKRYGKWDRQRLHQTAYELAAGAERAKSYRVNQLNTIVLDDFLRMKLIAVELQAVMEGEITTSSSEGLAIGSIRYGLNGVNYYQFYSRESFPRLQKTFDQHLSPAVRQKLIAAQRERKLETLIEK